MEDNLVTANDVNEYQKRSYDDLSSEFQGLFPSAVRAFQLIALMYDRLTLVEKLSHKDTLIKIYNDHRHLSGFSKRNISRNLPLDNPFVPRRVKPRWPKSSADEDNEPLKSSITIQEQDKKPAPKIYDCERGEGVEEDKNPKLSLTSDVNTYNDSIILVDRADSHLPESKVQTNLSLKECPGCKDLYIENCELKEALEKISPLITADKMSATTVSSSAFPSTSKDEECDILEFEFHLLKGEILQQMGELYPWIDDEDCKVWFSGKIDKKSGQVISAKTG